MVNTYVNFTAKDMVRMLHDIKQTIDEERNEAKNSGEVVGEETIISPVGWGAAMDFDVLESLMKENGVNLPYVRYDLSQSDNLWYGVRRITTPPQSMRRQLEQGLTRRLTKKGIRFVPLESPVSFEVPRIYIVFDDWTTSGLSLHGGEFYIAYNNGELNPYAIYGATLNDRSASAYFSVFKGYIIDGKSYLGPQRFFQDSLKEAYQILDSHGTLHLLRTREDEPIPPSSLDYMISNRELYEAVRV